MSACSFRFNIFFILISISLLFSGSISIDKAEKIAKYISVSRAGIAESQFEVHSIIQYPSKENVLIYIINVRDLGFVMVSADDNAEPLLGYSFEHYFTDLAHPIQFDAMLDDYTKQLNYIIDNDIIASDEIADAWKYYLADDIIIHNTRDVQPLLSAVWDQGHSWNDHCPEDNAGPGGNVWAGCTAVATAQVMYYWGHPQQGFGQHGYYHPDYGELYVNFSLHHYDWNNMNSNSPTEESRKLLYHIGVGVEMQYSPYGSGAWVGQYYPSAMSALKDYFSYSQDAVFYLKDNFNEGTWKSMVKDELDASRPLIYRGYTSDGSAGHAFNIDGYQGDNFHLNWGWSGSYNGWYLITNLSPGGYNFSTWQGGIFHLTPHQVLGCTDTEACNYQQNANTDDGSCYFIGDDFGEGPICNCEGDTDYDCLGECGGDAVIDECGECDGDGSLCAGNAMLSFGAIDSANQTFEIQIDSDVDIAGFQFTITDYPDNILVTHFSGGLAEENGFSVSCSDLGIVIGFSFDGNLIPAGSGVLTMANYDLIGNDDITQLCLEDVILSNQFGTSVNMTIGSCIDLILCSYSGDMNSDGIYNVLDAVIMVNMILGEMEENFCIGDLNQDGILNILDVISLINLILEQ